jgi:hypothetical protein
MSLHFVGFIFYIVYLAYGIESIANASRTIKAFY